jgi:hypothetical protein
MMSSARRVDRVAATLDVGGTLMVDVRGAEGVSALFYVEYSVKKDTRCRLLDRVRFA